MDDPIRDDGALLSALNFSTLIIALPDLITGLHASLLQAMWIMLAYMVAQTVAVLMAGSLADRYGRKRLYMFGLIVFTIFSCVSGFAPNAPMLIIFRILQGIGGAMVMANSTAIVADAFPREELGRALGINIMVVAVGQIIGPVLGGWLTTEYGWEWTFWFNVPFGVIAILWGMWAMGMKDVEAGRRSEEIRHAWFCALRHLHDGTSARINMGPDPAMEFTGRVYLFLSVRYRFPDFSPCREETSFGITASSIV